MVGLGGSGSGHTDPVLLHPVLVGSGCIRGRHRGLPCLPVISFAPTSEACFRLLSELRRNIESQRQAVRIVWQHEMDHQELLNKPPGTLTHRSR